MARVVHTQLHWFLLAEMVSFPFAPFVEVPSEAASLTPVFIFRCLFNLLADENVPESLMVLPAQIGCYKGER